MNLRAVAYITKRMSNCLHTDCKWKPLDNGYCKRHQREYEHTVAISTGREMCRFFFRGCNNTTAPGKKACVDCLAKKFVGKSLCKHTGCKSRTKVDAEYCMKHSRDEIREKASTDQIAYCDIDRGCYNICDPGRKSCEACLKKSSKQDRERYAQTKLCAEAYKSTTQRLCLMCNTKFTAFNTRHGKDSTRCPTCNIQQQTQDAKRQDRGRNYKEECMKNLDVYYEGYIRNAVKRNYEYTLDLAQFTTLVSAPCHYCNHNVSGEVNGIDRVDNTCGYIIDNCVACCEMCNRLKLHYDLDFFLSKMYIIANQVRPEEAYFTKWSSYYKKSKQINYKLYTQITLKRNMTMELTEEEYNAYTNSSCYLCGYTKPGALGIDRMDNTIRAYTSANCAPCCASCNIMKATYELDELREKAQTICNLHLPPASSFLVQTLVSPCIW